MNTWGMCAQEPTYNDVILRGATALRGTLRPHPCHHRMRGRDAA